MIKGISGSRYIQVSGGSPATTYISPGSVGSGMMRYNGNMNCIEINDGITWKQLDTSYAQIQLDAEAQELLDYVREKKQKEQRLDELMAQHPGLKDLHDKFEVMLALVQQSNEKS